MPRPKQKLPRPTAKTVKQGDDVVAVNDAGEHVARVVEVRKDQVKLRWFYKPEDVVYGRQVWHGSKELFGQTRVSDWNSVHSVTGFCKVHTLEEYEDLDDVSGHDYFCRQAYDPHTGGFVPDVVPLFCLCETPYNPDRPMVECEDCGEVFHCECVAIESNKIPSRYRCESCRLRSAPSKPGVQRTTGETHAELAPAKRGRQAKTLTKTGRKRIRKDPNAPKRSLTAYNFFVRDYRKKYLADRSPAATASVIEVTRACGKAWNLLGAKEREPFEAKARVDKEKYLKAKEEYIANGKRDEFIKGRLEDREEGSKSPKAFYSGEVIVHPPG
ncbi:BAH domain-containing protein [Chloropicon primus]|uniref:BAH domain-containing protein n=1 Tax=Chloropicon primus TaxID=1764295 RepID=A0A5B8MN53_9CHLO|nr:BAH domain-containing protein [Chloropicon primus]UPQ99974.1 BAH domain-containing protein [Chloropicon primus]|eukprot:QDZ20762.1 BAH domain-containing protein [Chloropicon primus]